VSSKGATVVAANRVEQYRRLARECLENAQTFPLGKRRTVRVIAAAISMIRELCSVPANWEPTNIDIVEFIDSLDKPFRRILERVAAEAKTERLTLH
jgi:hypothetical protein